MRASNSSRPCCRIRESGSSPAGISATRTIKIVLQKGIERSLRRFFAGSVRVETEHHFADKSAQNARLLFGERGALRRHHIRYAGFKKGNKIELSFADNGRVRIDQRALRLVQAVEDIALPEKRRLRAS